MLHCIPHQSVKLRSIALRRKRVSAKHGTLLRPARRKGRSIPRPFHFFPRPSTYIPRTFHLLLFTSVNIPFTSVYITCRSISFCVHSGFLHGAMRYCETLHSPSITFLSTAALPPNRTLRWAQWGGLARWHSRNPRFSRNSWHFRSTRGFSGHFAEMAQLGSWLSSASVLSAFSLLCGTRGVCRARGN